MKITTKMILFILTNLTLYLISFGLTQFYNNKTYEFQNFNSRMKYFESSLLSTIILEKDYTKGLNADAANIVISNIGKNNKLLEDVLLNATKKKHDLEILSKLLEAYRSKFILLSNNNNEILLLKAKWDDFFNDFNTRSDLLAQKIDDIIGMAYINGEDIDPLCNSFAISNKNIVNALGEISLAMNKDLLLDAKEEKFLDEYQKALAVLERERKNIPALAKTSKREFLMDFADYLEKDLEKIEGLTGKIHQFWKENNKIVLELEQVRENMITKEQAISSWIQSSMNNIKKKNFFSALIIVCIVFSVLILGGMLILQSIIRPIKKLKTMVISLAQGQGNLSMKIEFKRKDEIGELAKWFNIFIQNVQNMIKKIANNAEILTQSSSNSLDLSIKMSAGADRMSEISNTVSTATEEVSMNINTMASAAEEMSVNIQSISSTAKEMSQSMQFVALAIEEMSGAINDISQNAQEGASVSTQAMDMAKIATAAMNTLGDAAKEIGEVTKVITRIAEQTNLLALNATIEAASAGEAGKGFAVVANEIKELANQSARAAEDIARRIEGVQRNTEGAIKIINDVSEIINTINSSAVSITTAVEQQSHTASEIMSNVQYANLGVSNIASSIAEVAKGANDMSGNAGEAARGADEVASIIQSISQAASESNSDAKQVNTSAEELSRIAVQLEDMVTRFRVK